MTCSSSMVELLASCLSLPSSVDWTTQGVRIPVFHLGQCGSCWSFCTAGTSGCSASASRRTTGIVTDIPAHSHLELMTQTRPRCSMCRASAVWRILLCTGVATVTRSRWMGCRGPVHRHRAHLGFFVPLSLGQGREGPSPQGEGRWSDGPRN